MKRYETLGVLQDIFTDQQIARKFSGLIDSIILHLEKIKFDPDIRLNFNKHLKDSAGWIEKISVKMKSDKSSGDPFRLKYNYEKETSFKELKSYIESELRESYGFKGDINADDLEDDANFVINMICQTANLLRYNKYSRSWLYSNYKDYLEIT